MLIFYFSIKKYWIRIYVKLTTTTLNPDNPTDRITAMIVVKHVVYKSVTNSDQINLTQNVNPHNFIEL